MMMEPPPAATFEMIETEFVLELLVVPLDSPAQMSQTDEGGQRWPLGQDPLDGPRFGAVSIMGRPNAQGDESRAHAAPCTFTPGHRGPGREGQLPDERRHADGVPARWALQAPRRATTQATAPGWPRRHARR